ncbi:MAG: TrkH family potassium uptake protein [Lachnospiraceae bacterium]|nr:TrkH family potassium uptake protein [Lachnospiraceae bacterium]
MNYSIVRYIIGWVLKFEAAFLCLPALVGILYHEKDCITYFCVAVACLLVGLLLSCRKPSNRSLYTKEGFLIVALSWIIMSLFGALPFVLTGDIPSYVDAFFETVSGFTTTGASILSNVEALSRTNLFWRSFTHWIGGMGVFVFIMAITPLLGGSTMTLMKAESPGPSVDKLVPRLRDTSTILYGIYIVLTLVEVLLLVLFDMPVFEAFCTSFGTTGTGGFGVKNDSIAGYSPAIQNIVTIFMILSGINYGMYFLLLRRKWKQAFTFEEVRWYLGIIAAAGCIIFFNIRHLFPTAGEGLRHTFFQIGSIITTTGFASTDFNLWPQLSKTCLVLLMFIGACAGSTGGGIKVSRIMILVRTIRKELASIAHPQQVSKVRMDGHAVGHETIRSTNVFMVVYLILMLLSVLLISIDGYDFTTNFTAVAATINNIGPGLELVGPTGNYAFFSEFSKIILSFNMLAGRLELFPLLVLLSPACWKKH